jgi:2'-5' RNA ligase
MQPQQHRSFIAVELPVEVQLAIIRNTETLRRIVPGSDIRWVASRNMHLTIQFLGDVLPDDLDRLAKDLSTEIAPFAPFEVDVSGLGAFPNPRRARVLYVGLEAPPALASLVERIIATTSRLGFHNDERGFTPHLTIGRMNRTASAATLPLIFQHIQNNPVGRIGHFRVEAIKIFKSVLTPKGSVYTPLYSLPLPGVA